MKYKKKSFLSITNRPTSRLMAKLRKMTERLAARRNKTKPAKSSNHNSPNISI
ncbi:MAG: hypothetical protein ACI9P5_003781 [Saprospiraceae bacterium]|jgi:hypothetical protein